MYPFMNNIRKIRSFLFLFAIMLIPDILPGQEIDSIQYIDSLVEVLVRERRNWNEASRLLIDLGEPAVDPLLKILNDRSTGEWSRRKAAITLADIPAQRMAAPCIRICQDTTESMNLRIDAGRALKGKNISSYEKVFLEALQNENPFVRPVALRQLWHMGSGEALKIAFQAIRDEYNMVRRGGYEYLSQFDGASVNQAFLKGLFDMDWYVREYVFSELISRGETLTGSLEKIAETRE
jgi:HEAT repeat protein